MKNNNRLPKNGWYVKNDGSKRFKDTVIKYLNDNYGSSFDGTREAFYGISKNYVDENENIIYSVHYEYQKQDFDCASQITFQEFIDMIEDKGFDLEYFSDKELLEACDLCYGEFFPEDSIIRKIAIHYFGGDSLLQCVSVASLLLPVVAARLKPYVHE